MHNRTIQLMAIALILCGVLLFSVAIQAAMQDIPPVMLTATAQDGTLDYPLDWNPGLIPTETLAPTSDIPPAVATYNARAYTTATAPQSLPDTNHNQDIPYMRNIQLENFLQRVYHAFTAPQFDNSYNEWSLE